MAKRHNKKIKGAHAAKNAREARARKNANQKLTRLIDTALVKLDEAGKLYSCKVYLVLQTHKGQWTTYHNARGQDWPPSYSQIVRVVSLRPGTPGGEPPTHIAIEMFSGSATAGSRNLRRRLRADSTVAQREFPACHAMA